LVVVVVVVVWLLGERLSHKTSSCRRIELVLGSLASAKQTRNEKSSSGKTCCIVFIVISIVVLAAVFQKWQKVLKWANQMQQIWPAPNRFGACGGARTWLLESFHQSNKHRDHCIDLECALGESLVVVDSWWWWLQHRAKRKIGSRIGITPSSQTHWGKISSRPGRSHILAFLLQWNAVLCAERR